MPDAVYQVMTLLCALVAPLPIGTNLGLLHLLWMLVSGRLLGSREALFPGLPACGLSEWARRRAWATLGPGDGYERAAARRQAGWWPRRAAGSPTRTAALVPSRSACPSTKAKG